MINFDPQWKITLKIYFEMFWFDFCKSLTLTSSVSIEFSPERDVSSPADRVNADETCPDCRRQAPSYNCVPISICTENLTTGKTKLVIRRDRKSPIIKSHERSQPPKYHVIAANP